MMDKRSTFLLGGFLLIGAAILALGSGLRALDYILAAPASPIVRAVVSALLYPPVAAVVFLLGVVCVLIALKTPTADLSAIGPDKSKHRATEQQTRATEPNMVVLSTVVIPVDAHFQMTTPDSPGRAAIVRFRNDADRTETIGVMLGARAQIEVSDGGTNPLHVAGFWSDERSAYVNFSVGDTHDLVLAVRVADETSVPDVVTSNDDLRLWNVSALREATVKVRLIGGMERTIVREFTFRLLIQPDLRVSRLL